MARAFGLVEDRFCELYGVKEPRFLASYVPGVLSVADSAGKASRLKNKSSAGELMSAMVASFSESAGYLDLLDLVYDRTSRGSEVAGAIFNRAEELDRRCDELQTSGIYDDPNDEVLPRSMVGVANDPLFREALDGALREDGFRGDPALLWESVDRLIDDVVGRAGSLGVMDLVSEKVQAQLLTLLLVSSLEGPADRAERLGYSPQGTVSPMGGGGSPCRPAGLRLVPVEPSGPNPWDYRTLERDAVVVETWQTARFGRSDEWCAEGPSLHIPTTGEDISKRHCQLSWCDGDWVLADCGSLNGTLIVRPDGRRSLVADGDNTPVPVFPGDIICVSPARVGTTYLAESFTWQVGRDGNVFRLESA